MIFTAFGVSGVQFLRSYSASTEDQYTKTHVRRDQTSVRPMGRLGGRWEFDSPPDTEKFRGFT